MNKIFNKKNLKKIIILVIIIYIVCSLFNLVKLQCEKMQILKELQQKTNKYQKQITTNKHLQKRYKNSSDSKSVEEKAREMLDYAYPDEHIYVDVSGNS